LLLGRCLDTLPLRFGAWAISVGALLPDV
jgi:hypothetical protein